MLVLSMNSKRLRRPSVRLGEIGDVPAAFACGFSLNSKQKYVYKNWKDEFANSLETEAYPTCGFSNQKSSDQMVTEPGVSPRVLDDLQQNRENKNPNSSKQGFEDASSDEIEMPKSKLDFGKITRKSRVMRRKGQNRNGNYFSFGGAWNSKVSPKFNALDEHEDHEAEFLGCSSNTYNNGNYADDGLKDFSDHETPGTSKEACECANDAMQQDNECGFLKKDAFFEGNIAVSKSGCVWDETRFGGDDVNSVKQWLKELGFGKYAGVFEMHEVDEEALPLLTLEDLKEIGVIAVGPRRKLYTAIQELRGVDASS